jgi:amino acid transporter
MATTSAERPAGVPAIGCEDKGLKQGAIGLLSTTVIAISSTAPAYSLAAALGLIVVVAGMGFHAPAVMLAAFIPMLFVAQGYSRLNKEMPDCGTTFTWGAKTFGPMTGWLGGWAIFAADVIIMSNLAEIAGQYFFDLIGAYGLAASTVWTTVAGVAWIALMSYICYIGIEISARIQYGLLIIEIVMLIVLSITALVKVYAGTAPKASSADIKAHTFGAGPHHLALSWFNPFGISTSALGAGLLIAVFVYWGWDTAVSVNEETEPKDKTPGRAAIIATFVLLGTYLLVSASAEAFAGLGTTGIGLANTDNAGDVLSVLGASVFGAHGFGHILAKLLVLMVLTSSMASTLTTILPTARTTLSMAVYKAIPDRFARIHSKYLTPTWSTIGMAVISTVLYVGLTIISSNVLLDLVAAVGFPIAFYYAMTGFECVWWYRKRLFSDVRTFFGAGVLPLVGALILSELFVQAFWHYLKPVNSYTSFLGIGGTWWTGIGSLVLGAVLMLIWRALRPAYFRGEVLNKDTPVLVPDLAGVDLRAALVTEGLGPHDGPDSAPTEGDRR